MHWLLMYDYVEDILERRTPHREAHLGLAAAAHARGELLLAGAVGDPVDGAVFVFVGDDAGAAARFVEGDPYVENELVTSWRIRPWNVVVGN